MIDDPSYGFEPEHIPAIFSYFDTEHKGYLDRKDSLKLFNKIVKYSKGRWTKTHFSEWFGVLDADGEGKLFRHKISVDAVGMHLHVSSCWSLYVSSCS